MEELIRRRRKPTKPKTGITKAKSRIEDLRPALNSIGLDFRNSEKGEPFAGVMIHVFRKNKPKKTIKVLPWVRPMSMTQADLVKNLANYPRLNVPKEYKELGAEKCLEALLKMFKKEKLYFLVVMPRGTADDLYWLDEYSNIPEDRWNFTTRRVKGALDILRIRKTDSKAVLLQLLKKKFSKIFKNESK